MSKAGAERSYDFLNLQVIWQCGKIYYDDYKSRVNNVNIKLFDFIHNIKHVNKIIHIS